MVGIGMRAKGLTRVENLTRAHALTDIRNQIHEVGEILLIRIRLLALKIVEIIREVLLVQDVLGLEAIRIGEVEVVLRHPLAQIGAGHVLDLLALGVQQIEVVDAKLVGHGHIGVVGNALGDPVMAADRLEPPDLIGIGKCDAVHLVGSVLLEKRAQALNALAGGVDIRQDDGNEVLLGEAARHLGRIVGIAGLTMGGNILDERVGTEHALV